MDVGFVGQKGIAPHNNLKNSKQNILNIKRFSFKLIKNSYKF